MRKTQDPKILLKIKNFYHKNYNIILLSKIYHLFFGISENKNSYLEKFNVSLRDAQLARKKLNIQQIKSNKKMPFFESMGEREFDMPFPVRLFLDHQSNELYISKTEKQYSPPKLFFGIEEAFNIAPEISAAEAEKLLLDIQDEAEALLNESWIFWDGNNFRRESSERGNSIRNSLQIRIKNYLGVIS